MTARVDRQFLESRPKGTVIQVTDLTGGRFWLEAEGGAFRDFTHHHGTATYALAGRRARYGGVRLFWSAERLAGWVAEGLCTIELASPRGDSK